MTSTKLNQLRSW